MGTASDSRALLPGMALRPGHLFWRAQSRVSAALATVLPADVDLHAYAALLALSGGVTRSQQELADTIGVSRTTMVKVGADLSGQGLVRRVRRADDRRSYALTRTPEGVAAARRWRRHAEEVDDVVTTGFTTTEREQLRALLQLVAEPDLSIDVPEPLRESVAYLVTHVHARMHREFATALHPLDLMPAHVGVLFGLDEMGPVTQSEATRALGVSAPSMVLVVDELEQGGLVERRRHATDRRAQVLHLHGDTAGLVTRAHALADDVSDSVLAPLTPARRRRLLTLMQRFVTHP
ncbi:MarR family transcriptional regulator [Lapillicoccus sp.]|uniref:MarR family winged helix-turn-helix transcriptional regulator n=1 Tax=Lapillicoccus sp. TaxID=1909287 RepID=UPI0025DE2FA5|nr:MarR family transcriptional regulator [Lapillicoccus sp.]